MSWDISLTEKRWVEVSEVGNYTYNVSKMYVEAMGKTLSEFHGMKASEAIPILSFGIHQMSVSPEKYKAMNPVNGWGNYEGALMYLRKFHEECGKYPNSTIEVN